MQNLSEYVCDSYVKISNITAWKMAMHAIVVTMILSLYQLPNWNAIALVSAMKTRCVAQLGDSMFMTFDVLNDPKAIRNTIISICHV